MTTTLNLGVVDIPYAGAVAPKSQPKRRSTKPTSRANTATTGDVAQILESRYGIMAMFYLLNQPDIAAAIDNAMQGKLDNILMGQAPSSNTLFQAGDLSKIEDDFKRFIDQRGMDGRAAGVPTRAAERGVNHRMMHPYARRAARPSFFDTGTYRASMRAWVEED